MNPNPPRDDEPEALPPKPLPPEAPPASAPDDEDDPFNDPNRPPGTWSAMSDAANAGLSGIKIVE